MHRQPYVIALANNLIETHGDAAATIASARLLAALRQRATEEVLVYLAVSRITCFAHHAGGGGNSTAPC